MSVPGLPPLSEVMPFAEDLGVELGTATAEQVRGRLLWSPRLCTSAGVLHGGALMALADSVGAFCAFLNLPDGATTATIESKTNFFRAVRSEYVDAIATPLHVGQATIVVQTDLSDARGRRVARVTQTQAVLPAQAANG